MTKAAIIGTGFIGPAHVEALRRLGYVDVVAVAERDQATADAKAAELSIPKGYGDYNELLANPEIEVVHNCTPNHLHFAVNKAILAAGKHVVSEKPLAMNSTESRELVRLAEESGKVNAINFNYRYNPIVQQAHQMREHGDLGRVLAISRQLLSGLAAARERLELAARTGHRRRLAGGGGHRLAPVRSSCNSSRA